MPESDWEVWQTANLVSRLSLRENCESGNLSSPSVFQTTKGRVNGIDRAKRTVTRGGKREKQTLQVRAFVADAVLCARSLHLSSIDYNTLDFQQLCSLISLKHYAVLNSIFRDDLR